MMQTFFSRAGTLFASLLPLAEQPYDIRQPGDSAAARRDGEQDEDRLPERDESWYWAMHAHW